MATLFWTWLLLGRLPLNVRVHFITTGVSHNFSHVNIVCLHVTNKKMAISKLMMFTLVSSTSILVCTVLLVYCCIPRFGFEINQNITQNKMMLNVVRMLANWMC